MSKTVTQVDPTAAIVGRPEAEPCFPLAGTPVLPRRSSVDTDTLTPPGRQHPPGSPPIPRLALLDPIDPVFPIMRPTLPAWTEEQVQVCLAKPDDAGDPQPYILGPDGQRVKLGTDRGGFGQAVLVTDAGEQLLGPSNADRNRIYDWLQRVSASGAFPTQGFRLGAIAASFLPRVYEPWRR